MLDLIQGLLGVCDREGEKEIEKEIEEESK